jgi:hypothetical protein
MSSDYRVLCLSHDPALVVTILEWPNPDGAIAAAKDPASTPGLGEHRGCDLMVGRYSYPLIEVCCVGKPHCPFIHPPEWINVEWLRLLYAAMTAPASPALAEAVGSVPQCWRGPRVMRLRDELGVAEPSPIEILKPA